MVAKPVLYASLIDDQFDQGDPNVLDLSEHHATDYRYYTFVTDDSEYGRAKYPSSAFPVYGSNDLASWTYIGRSLTTNDNAARWAPCIVFCPELERPFVMLYSRARGTGEDAHVQHKIRRADSTTPHGPYIDSGEILTPDLDFSIDPNIYRNKSGKLHMAFATDFVEDEPLGTGLSTAEISDDLRKLIGPPQRVARAQSAWQIYESGRSMPWKEIPNVNWERGDRVNWHCMEGPVGGIVGPTGRRFFLYSSGNYSHFYAVGVLEEQDKNFVDLSVDQKNCLLAPQPEKHFFSVGRIGVINGPDGQLYASFHARFGSPEAPRRFGLCRLDWTEDGAPFCPPI